MSTQSDNLKAAKKFEAVAAVMGAIPTMMAQYYANGGAGVGQGVVGDRFQGAGNTRFEPLDRSYFVHKQGRARELNKAAKAKYGKGSKLIEVPFKSSTGTVVGFGKGANLPILVLTGKLRAAVTARKHTIVQQGDVAIINFTGLPPYAEYLHTGTSKMPKRSPVEPNDADLQRCCEFANRQIQAAIGEGTAFTQFGLGTPRLFP